METWPAIAVACGAIGGILGGVAKWLYDRGVGESKAAADIALAEAQSTAAAAQIASVTMQISEVRSALHTHEVADAAAFGELRALALSAREVQVGAERRLTDSLAELMNEFRGLRDRVDRILEARSS
jgi:hypothetical protein